MENKVFLIVLVLSTLCCIHPVAHETSLMVSDVVVSCIENYTASAELKWEGFVDLVLSPFTSTFQRLMSVLQSCEYFLQRCFDGVINCLDMIWYILTRASETINGVVENAIYRPLYLIISVAEFVIKCPLRLVSCDEFFKVFVNYIVRWPLTAIKYLVTTVVSLLLGIIKYLLTVSFIILYCVLGVFAFIVKLISMPISGMLMALNGVRTFLLISISILFQILLMLFKVAFYLIVFPCITLTCSAVVYSFRTLIKHLLLLMLPNVAIEHCSKVWEHVCKKLAHWTSRSAKEVVRLVDHKATDELHDCAICFEDKQLFKTLPCGHDSICYACLQKSVRINNRCPLCRSPIHQIIDVKQ